MPTYTDVCYVMAQLIEPPMTAANARALGALAGVAGDSISSRIPTILGALNDGMESGDLPEDIAVAAEKVHVCSRMLTYAHVCSRDMLENIAVAAEEVVLDVPQDERCASLL